MLIILFFFYKTNFIMKIRQPESIILIEAERLGDQH